MALQQTRRALTSAKGKTAMLKEENLPPTDGKWEYDRQTRRWCSRLNGRIHNSLGPALIYDDGGKAWLVNGKLHRLDGPAFECADGYEEWYVGGGRTSERGFPSAVISFLLGVDFNTAIAIEQEIES